MWKMIGAAPIAVLLAFSTASAAELGGKSRFSPKTAPPEASAAPSCSCRYPGGTAELGDTVCMTAVGERYLARCEMVLNNTAWKRVRNGCEPETLSALSPLDRLAQLAQPALDPSLVHAQISRPVN